MKEKGEHQQKEWAILVVEINEIKKVKKGKIENKNKV